MERFCDRRFGRGIDQQLCCVIREIVASGSVHTPVFAQRFGARQDFFREQVNRASVLGQSGRDRFRATLLKLLKIFAWQVKSVRMINTKACHCAAAHQIES